MLTLWKLDAGGNYNPTTFLKRYYYIYFPNNNYALIYSF